VGSDPKRRLVREGEELNVLSEPLCQREGINKLVVALDGLTVRGSTDDGCL
jgi:hypothetical protein